MWLTWVVSQYSQPELHDPEGCIIPSTPLGKWKERETQTVNKKITVCNSSFRDKLDIGFLFCCACFLWESRSARGLINSDIFWKSFNIDLIEEWWAMLILQPHFQKELVIPMTFLTTGKYAVLGNNSNLEKTWNDWTVKDYNFFLNFASMVRHFYDNTI